MAEQPLTAGQAREIAKPMLQFARALEESVRVLEAAKLAGGKLAQAEASRAAALATVEAAQREREALAAETAAERERQLDAVRVEAAAEGVRLARGIESERLTVARLQEEHQTLQQVIIAARQELTEARKETERGVADMRREATAERQSLQEDLAAVRGQLTDLTGRLEAKRKEYRDLLDQVKSVLRA